MEYCHRKSVYNSYNVNTEFMPRQHDVLDHHAQRRHKYKEQRTKVLTAGAFILLALYMMTQR